MTNLISILRVVHIITAVLMAWPFYALVLVSQRVKLGPPLGDRTDIYLENTIKNRTIPCFVFQITALVTGIALMLLRGMKFGALISNPVLGLKFVLLILIMGILSYVHFTIQPKLDKSFGENKGTQIPTDVAAQIGSLRAQRKHLASICMFVVLTVAMLGSQVYIFFPPWLTILLVAAIALFTRRAYKSEIPYGWF